MKWLIKIIDCVQRETWWRRRYKRVNLSNPEILADTCLACDAATGELQCDILKGRECPCKLNQCLKIKNY